MKASSYSQRASELRAAFLVPPPTAMLPSVPGAPAPAPRLVDSLVAAVRRAEEAGAAACARGDTAAAKEAYAAVTSSLIDAIAGASSQTEVG